MTNTVLNILSNFSIAEKLEPNLGMGVSDAEKGF